MAIAQPAPFPSCAVTSNSVGVVTAPQLVSSTPSVLCARKAGTLLVEGMMLLGTSQLKLERDCSGDPFCEPTVHFSTDVNVLNDTHLEATFPPLSIAPGTYDMCTLGVRTVGQIQNCSFTSS